MGDPPPTGPQVCAAGDSRLLQGLLEFGLDPNAADLDGRTGLHLASERGAHLLVEALLRAGAHPSARDGHGFTPLLEAVRRGHVSVARELFEAGATLGLVDDVAGALAREPSSAGGGSWVGLPGTKVGLLSAEAELSAAVQRGQLEYLRLLLSFGANPDAADPFDGRTAARAHPARREGSTGAATPRALTLLLQSPIVCALVCEISRAGGLIC